MPRNIVQIVILDSRDYILEFQDFKPTDRDGINIYIWQWMAKPDSNKIQIRKW